MTVEEALEIVESVLDQGRLNKVQEIVFRHSWAGQSYMEIAKSSDYDAGYLKDAGSHLWQELSRAFGEKVTKNNLYSVLERHCRLRMGESRQIQVVTPNPITADMSVNKHQDWGEAIDVSIFYGRAAELTLLEQWIVTDRCRLVALLGMGGIGKTTLSVKLAQQIQGEFEYLVWRSLRNAPPAQEMITTLIKFLSNQQETNLPETVGDKISRLIEHLRQRRCLLILDNTESVLRSGDRAGHYRKGYEDYGELLRRVGEESHQSCLILTSREQLEEVAFMEGQTLPVRALQLKGLQEAEGLEILKAKSLFGSETTRRKLIQCYTGNPLALKIASTSIQELFAGNIAKFLEQSTAVFNGIYTLLEHQFNRLSTLEKQIMYWLAINCQPVSPSELQGDIVPPVSNAKLLESLESLRRRSLIEMSLAGFTQQPVVIEYVTERLIDQVCEEIETEQIVFFNSYALIKSQSKVYVRNAQVCLILKPVVDKLITSFGRLNKLADQLQKILASLRNDLSLKSGYLGGNILNILCYLKIDLTGYDFSNLTVWQACLQGVSLHSVNFAHSDLSKSTFTETFGSILSVVFSPDGQLVATGDTNGEICLWQATDWRQLFRYKGHTNWVRSVAFSPDGRILASGSADRTVKLWDVKTGQCLKTLHGHASRVWSVVFGPDGQIASGSDDQTIKLWDANTGECLNLLGHTGRIRSVVFSPDGQIASGSDDQTIKLWDANTGECLKTFQGHTNGVRTLAFNPVGVSLPLGVGQVLASGSADCTVKLWDIDTGQCLNTMYGHTNEVWSVAFSPVGVSLPLGVGQIASGSNDQTIKLWDVQTGQCLKTLQGHTKEVWSVAFSPDGHTLVSGSNDQTIKLWNISNSQCLKTLQGYTNGVRSVACSPVSVSLPSGIGQILAISSADHAVRLWNINTGQCLKTLLGHTGQVWSVAFSPDGQIATGSEDQTIRLWDVNTGQCLKTLQGHTDWVWSVAFGPDGQIASSSDDCTVRLWDVNSGQCLKILQGHTDWVWSVAYPRTPAANSLDGQILASSSNDQTIRLWDVQTGQCLKVLQGHTNGVRSISFSPDGQTLVSGSEDQTVRLWDVHSGQCLKILQGHTDWVWSVAFNPVSTSLPLGVSQIASSSNDQTIRLWDVQTGQCLKIFQGHTNWVRSVVFHPDGQTLISGSEDETTKLWNIQTGQCLSSLVSKRPYEDMNITGVTGLTAATIVTLKALGAIERQCQQPPAEARGLQA